MAMLSFGEPFGAKGRNLAEQCSDRILEPRGRGAPCWSSPVSGPRRLRLDSREQWLYLSELDGGGFPIGVVDVGCGVFFLLYLCSFWGVATAPGG